MNYILFFPDEMRAETLGCYGNSLIRTPNYDRLAREGTRFDQCHVQNPVCSPSRCCLATGRYVHTDGHRTLWNLVKPHEKNLLRYFHEAGYDVRVFGKNDMLTEEAIPLSVREFRTEPGLSLASGGPADNLYNFLYNPPRGDGSDHRDALDVANAISFLESRKPGDPPFFLFLPLVFPHTPYTVFEPWFSMYDKTPALRPKGTGKPLFHSLIPQYRHLEGTDFQKIQAVYMGMVSYADALLGRVLEAVDRLGLGDDTTLIAASDHGDYAGDYGLVEKWPSGLEDVLTRVPLLVRGPGVAAGHQVREPVQLIDLLPTLLELARIPLQHTQFGTSLTPQLRGNPGDPDRAVFCEGGYNKNEPHCNEGYPKPSTAFMMVPEDVYFPKGRQQLEHPESVGRSVMIRTMDYKLIRRTYGDHELYDLKKDPKELENVWDRPEYRQIRQELELRLLDWYLATGDAVPVEEDVKDLPGAFSAKI